MIRLDENYTITNDRLSWTLHYEKDTGNTSKGKLSFGEPIIYTQDWYYSNIDHCLVKYLDEALKPCESVGELLDRVWDLKHELTKIKELW